MISAYNITVLFTIEKNYKSVGNFIVHNIIK